MTTTKKLIQILLEIYSEVYKHTKPKLDFKKAHKQKELSQADWFTKYYMPEPQQQRIMEKVMKKYKLNKHDKQTIKNSYWLGSSPTSNKTRYEREVNKKMTKNTHYDLTGGVGFTGLLTLTFIILKLTGTISWSWWWILSPLWISLCVILLVLFIVALWLISTKKG